MKLALVILGGLVFYVLSGAPSHVVGAVRASAVPAPPAAPAPPVPAPPPAPAGPGVVWTEAQLQAALQAQGLTPAHAHVGAAIAEAESGGRSDAVHLCPPRCDPGQGPEESWGAWQLNRAAHPWVSVACAVSLACAAHAVAVISGWGADWTPWSTYGSGAYLRWL